LAKINENDKTKTDSKKQKKRSVPGAGKSAAKGGTKPAKHFQPFSLARFLISFIKITFVTAIVAAVIFGGILINYAVSPIDEENVSVTVDIPTGASFVRAARILDEAGLINNHFLFYSLAMVKKATRVIRAGEYEFNTSLTPGDVINKLMRGDIKNYLVTIPEDFTYREVAHRLGYFRLIDEDTFLRLARDEKFLTSLGIPVDSIEGYLFPNTYLFNRSMSTSQIIRIMVSQFWKEVTPEMVEQAAEMGFTLHEVVTLASLIGKESGYHNEKTLISAVFHNRLKRNKRLQSDPTAVYDMEDFQGKILRSHLRRESPYNTYVINGLPPGPIGNPGLASIKAALNPAPVKYLYFVSQNDGTHAFSETLAQHNEAVRELRRLQRNAANQQDS